MLKYLYPDLLSGLATISLLLVIAFIIGVWSKRQTIKHWGLMILILVITGLAVCCLVCTRDDYALSLQGGSGLFALDSLTIYAAYGLGAVNFLAALTALLINRPGYRRTMFAVIAGSIILKALIVEISRLILLM